MAMDSDDIDDLEDSALRGEMKSLTRRFQRLEEENEMLQDNLDDDIADQLQVLKDQITDLQDRNRELRRGNGEDDFERENWEAVNSEKEEELLAHNKKLTAFLEFMKEQNEKREKEMEELERKLKEALEALANATSNEQVEELKKKLEEKEKELEQLKKDYEQLKKDTDPHEILKLKDEVARLQDLNLELEERNQMLQDDVDALEEENSELRDELQTLYAKVAQVDRVKSAIRTVTHRNAELERENKDAKEQFDGMRELIETLTKENKELLQQLHLTMNERNELQGEVDVNDNFERRATFGRVQRGRKALEIFQRDLQRIRSR